MFLTHHQSTVVDGPVILFDSIGDRASLISATSAQPDGSADNAFDTLTYDFWRPAVVPAELRVKTALAEDVDCVGIAAHTLGSTKSSFRVLRGSPSLRTNEHLSSEDFSTGWSTSSASAALLGNDPSVIDPAGTLKSGKLTCSDVLNVSRRMYLTTGISVTPGAAYSASIYIKPRGNWSWFGFAFAAGTTVTEAAVSGQVNLVTGQIALQAGQIFVYPLSDGWYKVVLIGNVLTSTLYRLTVSLVNGAGSTTSPAVGIVGAGCNVFGAHVELGSSYRGYIPSTASVKGTSNYIEASDFLRPSDNSPIITTFPLVSTTDVALSVTGPGSFLPSVGVFFAGKSLLLPTGISPSYTPIYLAREIDLETSKTRGGQFMGNRVMRRGARGRINLIPMLHDYVQGTMLPFINYYDDGKPFFFASSPSFFSVDTSYCWRSDRADPMRPSFDEGGLFMSVSMDVEAIVA